MYCASSSISWCESAGGPYAGIRASGWKRVGFSTKLCNQPPECRSHTSVRSGPFSPPFPATLWHPPHCCD